MTEQEFLDALPSRAQRQIDRAVLIAAYLKAFANKPATSAREIAGYFELAHLARPNTTHLADRISSDSRVSIRGGQVKSLVKGDALLREKFPELFDDATPAAASLAEATRVRLQATPLIEPNHLSELEPMLELYATLHVLENSMRVLIETVLKRHLGDEWWETAASGPQKRKHADRLEKEQTRKWLPARSELGPLYSLDWSDLISMMRKYEGFFLPFIGEIDFLHRFADLGNLRHVVAHHGFVDDATQFERASLALYDWQRQVGSRLDNLQA
jgi:hypothetical protein